MKYSIYSVFSCYLLFCTFSIDAKLWSSSSGFCQKVIQIPKVIRRIETYYNIDAVPVECRDPDEHPVLCQQFRNNIGRRIVTKQIFQSRSIRTCCTGYYKLRRYCVPQCEPECENGVCSEPNVCTCSEGYKNSTFYYKCEPDCGNSCINGNCSAPNVCNCLDGYKKNESDVCEPICENGCSNGKCIAPNTCECDNGYQLNPVKNHTCDPVCSNRCKFGICVAPEECSCLEGHSLALNSTTDCHPICDSCENGKCVAPNVCQCSAGFELAIQQKGMRNITICIPNCKTGYKLANSSTTECVPNCGLCINGSCVSPGRCECLAGYKEAVTKLTMSASNTTICKPTCLGCEAPNVCLAPNNCSCHANYRSKKINLTESKAEASVCELYCDPPCDLNSHCVENNICDCNSGYHKNKSNVCEKTCDHECIFGECRNGECVCESGFKLAVNSSFNCEPFCDVPCKNGHCAGDNVCACDVGYALSSNDTECVAVCEKNCINGICYAPNICECNEGYHQIGYEDDHVCEPRCNEFESFEEDFMYINGSSGGCLHGTCVAPNTCRCNDGFELSDKNNFTCILKNNTNNCVNCYSLEKLPKKITHQTTFIIIFALLLSVISISVCYVKFFRYRKAVNEKEVGLRFCQLKEDPIDCKQKSTTDTSNSNGSSFNDDVEIKF